jgi:hypothetical protein
VKDEESSWVMLCVGDAVRGQGKTRGAFGFALNFWPHLFFQEKKVENIELKKRKKE